jgi:glycine/D-amino acid oxidase-like deaminating enzyme
MGGDTAQVTPSELTGKMMDAAVAMGVKRTIADVTGVAVESGKVVGVKTRGNDDVTPVDAVVVCMGPWSGVFCEDHFGIRMPMVSVPICMLISFTTLLREFAFHEKFSL